MKVSIIGGGGLVGSMTAFALQCGKVVSGISLIDANQDLARSTFCTAPAWSPTSASTPVT
jgi:malate/lactate dehydrogenase